MNIIYFLVSFIQPILLFTPEMVTITGGSLVLGPLRGFIIGFFGILSGAITMYFIGRYAQQMIVNKIGKENLYNKYKRYVEKNGDYIIGLLFVLPVLPDNIICVGAGISKFPFKKFLLIAALSKLTTTFVYAYSIELANIFAVTKLQLVLGQLSVIIIVYITNYFVKKSKLELV